MQPIDDAAVQRGRRAGQAIDEVARRACRRECGTEPFCAASGPHCPGSEQDHAGERDDGKARLLPRAQREGSAVIDGKLSRQTPGHGHSRPSESRTAPTPWSRRRPRLPAPLPQPTRQPVSPLPAPVRCDCPVPPVAWVPSCTPRNQPASPQPAACQRQTSTLNRHTPPSSTRRAAGLSGRGCYGK